MEHYAGIDVSLESASVCVVDQAGRIVREGKVASQPDALIGWFEALGVPLPRIGLEAGPLSQWLFAALAKAGLAVELLETRHVRDAFKAMPVKTDRKDGLTWSIVLATGRRFGAWCRRPRRSLSPSACSPSAQTGRRGLASVRGRRWAAT